MRRIPVAWVGPFAAVGLVLAACGPDAPEPRPAAVPAEAPAAQPSDPPVDYVGTARCASCHADAFAAWRGSHHDLAMQEATPEAVLGDFGGARFEHFGSASTFFRRDGRFFVRTEGADGAPAEFEIAYAFGVAPLQQYLVRFPEVAFRRSESLGILVPRAREVSAGFTSTRRRRSAPATCSTGTQPAQRWNTQCAACHSTT